MTQMQKIYMKARSGSRLYGTNGPDSDYDYKVIVEPSVKDILLGRAETSSQSIKDEDLVTWTYQKWVNLLLKMDSNAYEIYLDNEKSGIRNYPVREILTDNRAPAIGFVDSSLSRYAVRGQRVEDFEAVVKVLHEVEDLKEAAKIIVGWRGVTIGVDPMGVPLITVHARSIPVTSKVKEAIKLYQRQVDKAGKRTVDSIGSTDWKGIAHGLRIAKQMTELVKTGTIQFPLAFRDELIEVRNGLVDYDSAVARVVEAVDELRNLPPSSHLASPDNDDARNAAEYCIVNYHNSIVLGPL